MNEFQIAALRGYIDAKIKIALLAYERDTRVHNRPITPCMYELEKELEARVTRFESLLSHEMKL